MLGLGLSIPEISACRTGTGGVVPPMLRRAPYGFDYVAPFNAYVAGATYSHDFSMAAARPVPTHTVYCGPGGDNAASGLAWATRVRSLKQAILRANALGTSASVIRVLAQAGEYRNTSVDAGGIKDSFDGQYPDRHMIIEPCDASGTALNDGSKIVSTHCQAMPPFAATGDPNVHVAAYTTEVPTPVAWDMSRINAKGFPQALRNAPPATGYANEAAIIAGVNAKAAEFGHGALYLDTTNRKLYIRLGDGRPPDSHLVVGRGAPGGGSERNLYLTGASQSTFVFWARDLQMRGGAPLYAAAYQGGGEMRGITSYFADCAFLYGSLNGVSIDPAGTHTFLRCAADDNLQDGFNYDQSTGLDPDGTAVLRFHELDCSADWNGNNSRSDVSANASSAHLRVKGLRINCRFDRTLNRAVHDIAQSKTWNLGVIAANCRQSGVQSAGFASGFSSNTGETTRMWLDGCRSDNNAYDLEAYKGGTLSYAVMNTAGYVNEATTGTIAAYNPDGVGPGAVGTLSATPLTDTSIQLAFATAANAVGYEYTINDGVSWATLAGNRIVTGLAASTSFTIRVRAYADHYGPVSNAAGATTNAPSTPTNIIANGDMSSATAWDKLWGGWSISGGLMRMSAVGAFNDSGQAVSPVTGKYYEVSYTVLNYGAGTILCGFGGTGASSDTTGKSTNGTYTERIQAKIGQNRFRFVNTAGPTTLNIDNVSVVGPYDTP